MDAVQFQQLIDTADTPEQMLEVAQGYLSGEVILDKTATEAWLMRVIQLAEPVTSAKAVRILAQLLGKPALMPGEAEALRGQLSVAEEEEARSLRILLDEEIIR